VAGKEDSIGDDGPETFVGPTPGHVVVKKRRGYGRVADLEGFGPLKPLGMLVYEGRPGVTKGEAGGAGKRGAVVLAGGLSFREEEFAELAENFPGFGSGGESVGDGAESAEAVVEANESARDGGAQMGIGLGGEDASEGRDKNEGTRFGGDGAGGVDHVGNVGFEGEVYEGNTLRRERHGDRFEGGDEEDGMRRPAGGGIAEVAGAFSAGRSGGPGAEVRHQVKLIEPGGGAGALGAGSDGVRVKRVEVSGEAHGHRPAGGEAGLVEGEDGFAETGRCS